MARLIVALDYPEKEPALAMARALQGSGAMVKVGLELYTREGPDVVRALRDLGLPVMLDLKFHDIPNTVKGAVRSACALDAEIVTVHLSGGERMIRAAAEGAAEGAAHYGTHAPMLFGITVLTSLAPGELPGISGDLGAFAVSLARSAALWGASGVVCSGHEAAAIKAACPSLLALTPGIRPAGGSTAGDQRRIMTPAQAVAAGSDYLVVGRPITKAADPASAARAILAEMAASAGRS